jgi:hypothetical protein
MALRAALRVFLEHDDLSPTHVKGLLGIST